MVTSFRGVLLVETKPPHNNKKNTNGAEKHLQILFGVLTVGFSRHVRRTIELSYKYVWVFVVF